MRLSFFQEVLLATAAGLAVVLMVEMCFVMPAHVMSVATVSAQLHRQPQSTAPSREHSLVLPTRDSLRAFIERPLFERSRRNTGAPYERIREAESIADVALIRTVVTLNERIAVLQFENGPSSVRARIGDVVGGWRVVQIRPNAVLLSDNFSEQWISNGAQEDGDRPVQEGQ